MKYKYTVRHGKDVDFHELVIKDFTITMFFWTIKLWGWDFWMTWRHDSKGLILPWMEINLYKINR